MNWKAILDRALRFAYLITFALFGYAAAREGGLYRFTAPEANGLNTMILLMGSIYAVMFAFVIFVIWTQFTEVEAYAMRECNALNDLLRFSDYVNQDARHAIRRAVGDYARSVAKSEWPCLAGRRKDRQTEKAFSDVMDAVFQMAPANPGDEDMRRRMIDIARKAGEHRDERIAKSLTRIPPTLIRLVATIAGALLLLVFLYPFHHWLTGAASFFLLAVVLFLANVVMGDIDNPFEGVYNVSPRPFSELTQ